jgi:8-oxo-dGTP diphosphatase
LQFREPELDSAQAAAIFRPVLDRVRDAGAIILVNSRHPPALWDKADGVHLTAADLARARQRPGVEWVAASTHSRTEIQRAAAIGADFIVAGPVLPTATHTDRVPRGWDEFADLIAETSVPAYALGGLQMTDLSRAIRCGAHGIASLSAAWNGDQWFGVFNAPAAMSGVVSVAVADPAIE